MLTVTPPLVSGLSALAGGYDAVLCDVWGVLHNGVAVYPGASEALIEFRARGGKVVLLTNAPRPAGPIHEQLARLGVAREAYDDLLTSGDVTREMLHARAERRIVHIGPERDLPLYDGLALDLVDDADGEVVVVTGLTDDSSETPEDYRTRLAALAKRRVPMVCANPDLIVERGIQRVYGAGALARLYVDELGGEAMLIGKPYAPVYEEARMRITALTGKRFDGRRVLAIGDGLATDIRGAFNQKLDVLFITAGIHGVDFGPLGAPDPKLVEARLIAEDLAVTAMLPRLVW